MNQPTDDPQGRSADHATGLPEAEPRPLLSHMDASPTTDLLDRRQHAERNTPTPTTKPRPFSVAATRQLMSQLRERLRLERKSVTLSTVVREEDEEGIASNSDVDGYDAADESTQLLGDMSEHAVDMAVQDVDSDNDDEDVQNRSPYSSTPPFRDASKRLEQAPWKRVTKATLAFMFASALTFLVPIREQIGPMSHFAALAVLFFHPCKSVGAMLEATVTGLLGIAFAAAVSAGGILASQAVNEAVGAGHSASAAYYATAATVLVIVFSATFLLAFVRAKSSQSPVYTGMPCRGWVCNHAVEIITSFGIRIFKNVP